jgi:hypothetical protein
MAPRWQYLGLSGEPDLEPLGADGWELVAIPNIPQVLAAILPDLPADRLIVAQEQQHLSPARWKERQEGPLPVEAAPHGADAPPRSPPVATPDSRHC